MVDKENTMKELNQLLKKYTADELARKLGVNRATVFFWKSGVNKPSRMAQEKIIRFFLEEKLSVRSGGKSFF